MQFYRSMGYGPKFPSTAVALLLLTSHCAAAQIDGYPAERSHVAGDILKLHLSSEVSPLTVRVQRVGAETRMLWSQTGVPVGKHDIPKHASSHGCDWPVALAVRIPAVWPSGCYEAIAEWRHGDQVVASNPMFFVIRSSNPGRDSKILLQISSNTYNAYNNWGGHSLYEYWGIWDVRHEPGDVLGRRVTFQRPFRGVDRTWEVPFIRWAEKEGYKIDYAINNDLEFNPEILQHYKLVLSVGHDEYWSAGMRDNLERFVADGGNVAFFSGNVCCWQVRNEDHGNDMVCWKEAFAQDPIYRPEGPNPLLSTLWSHHLVQRPENQLTGVGVLRGGFNGFRGNFMDGGDYQVHRPEHWVFEGTGLSRNDRFGKPNTIVGYECDGCEFALHDGLPVPTGRDGTPKNFTILATAPARWGFKDVGWYKEWHEEWKTRERDHACMGIYRKPGGGTVFTAATTDWSHGLSSSMVARGPLGPGNATRIFDGDIWNGIGNHFVGKVVNQYGAELPFRVTVEFGASTRDTPIDNWGAVAQNSWVNTNAPAGIGNTDLMNDMLYAPVPEGEREQAGVRIKGLPAGTYEVFAAMRHFEVPLAERFEWSIGVNQTDLSEGSFVSPGGGSLQEWVRAGPDRAGNYARAGVTISGPDDYIVMLVDNLDSYITDIMGFQIARIPPQRASSTERHKELDEPIYIQFDVGSSGPDTIVQRISRNILNRLSK